MKIPTLRAYRGPVEAIRPINPVAARRSRRVQRLATPELAQVSARRRDEAALGLQPHRSDGVSLPTVNNKRVEAFLTNVLKSGLSSQVLAKAILRNFDKHNPLHTELSQEAVVTALGSVASHAATANLPALFMSALEVLSKLAQASNHPIAEIAAQRLYSLRRYENNARTRAQELGINATASHSNQAGVEIAFAD